MVGKGLIYRVVVFGKPVGPWRSVRSQANQDAIELELGSYDENGQFYVTVPADIQSRYASSASLAVSEYPALYTKIRALR